MNIFSLLKFKRFAPLFWVQFLGAFSDNVFKSALLILITYKYAVQVGIDASILNMVAAGICDEILVQVSYAIGVVEPTSIFVDTYGTCPFNLTDGEIAEKVSTIFDMRPAAIEERLKLRQPMYSETAAYGHMGRQNEVVTKVFDQPYGKPKTMSG